MEVLTGFHVHWMNSPEIIDFTNREFAKIFNFFVLETPCIRVSARGVSLQTWGWKEKPWDLVKYLKEPLDKVLFGEERNLRMVGSANAMSDALAQFDMKEGFYNFQTKSKAVFVRNSQRGMSSEYMSLFYRVRNALAHGRFAIYRISPDDFIYVLEDGKLKKMNNEDSFRVTGRMVIKQSSFLNIIELIKQGPRTTNNYEEEVLLAIRNGNFRKKSIINAVGLEDKEYQQTMTSLKDKQIIAYDKKTQRWKIIE